MENPFAYNRCKILSKHFIVGLWRNVNYIVNIIEKFSGSGRDDNGIPIPGATGQRQKMETKWLITLQTVYPYGLNDKVGDEYKAGNLYKCPKYNYSKIELDNSFLKQSFFKVTTSNLDHNIEDAVYFVFVTIKSFKKSFTYVMMSVIFLGEK